MTWIRTVPEDEAEGQLARFYEQAVARAGRVFGIVKTMSLSPPVLEASMALYRRIMFARVGLARRQRELLAVIVSRVNDCHY